MKKIFIILLLFVLVGCQPFFNESKKMYTITFNELNDDPIIKIKTNSSSVLALTENGSLYKWGDSINRTTFPHNITNLFTLETDDKIIDFTMSDFITYIITLNHHLFSLKNNEVTNLDTLFELVQNEEIVSIKNNANSYFALTTNDNVLAWGDNSYGQLGIGNYNEVTNPMDIDYIFNLPQNEHIIDIAPGGCFTLALSSEGNLFSFGDNTYGQLGNNSIEEQKSPVNITSSFHLQPEEKIAIIAAGTSFAMAITTNNRIYTWGDNYVGQLGNGSVENSLTPSDISSTFTFNENEKVNKVRLGENKSFIITSQNRVFGWGSNMNHEISSDNNDYYVSPREIRAYISKDNVIDLQAQLDYCIALTTNNKVITWGRNTYGQIGDGTTAYKSSPTLIDFDEIQDDKIDKVIACGDETYVFLNDRKIYGYGYKHNITNKPTNLSELFVLEDDDTIIKLYNQNGSYYALSSKGHLFTWGNNSFGQLGDGTTIDKTNPTEITSQFNLTNNETIISIKVNENKYFAFTSLNRVFGWGVDNNNCIYPNKRQLTPYDITSLFSESIQDIISYNENNIIVLSSTGEVSALGYFLYQGNFTDKLKLTEDEKIIKMEEDLMLTSKHRLIRINENNQFVEEKGYPLNDNEYVVDIVKRENCEYVITSQGRLLVRGVNTLGTDNNLYALDFTKLLPLDNDEKISKVESGNDHTFIITSKGKIYGMGDNLYCQLGIFEIWSAKAISFADELTKSDFLEGNKITIPQKDGYTCLGLYEDINCSIPFNDTKMPSENITLYIRWKKRK